MKENLVMSDYAIEHLIEATIREFKEVEGIGSDFAKELIDLFDGDEAKKGIKIKRENEALTIDILLRVFYLVDLIDLSKKLRKRVKETLEKFTPYKIKEINFYYIDVKDRNEG